MNKKTKTAIDETKILSELNNKKDEFKNYCPNCADYTYHNTGGCVVCGFIKELQNEK